MEELVTVLRKLWKLHEGPVRHEGRFYTLDLRPTTDTPPPFRERLPIWVAGVTPRMIEAAGRVGDGLVGHPMFTKKYIDEVARPALARGAAHAGRDDGDAIAMSGVLMCAVGDDLAAGRRRLAFAAAQYAASRVYDRLFTLHGWTAEQEAIRAAVRAGDAVAIEAAVTDVMVDAIGVVCRAADLPAAVARHAADYDHLVLTPPPWGLTLEEAEAETHALIDAMAPALAGAASERSLTSTR
jgi:alkanesulfonate monooxygenase SsuD/methylene tetrahydromethanopterin reductase-like flavin-dependent oxidoreductase (luciferase family)